MEWILAMLLLTASDALMAREGPLKPLPEEKMRETRLNQLEAAGDRDELNKDEVEELQEYLRKQPLRETEIQPPRQPRQQEEQGLSPFQRNFRDALIRSTRENQPAQ